MLIIKQPKPEYLENLTMDFLIVASGYESRAVTQAKKYSSKAIKKIALGFSTEENDKIRINNDKILHKLGFSIHKIVGEMPTNTVLSKLINEIEKYASKNKNTNVYIDYSCMTKNWYSYMLFNLCNIKNNIIIYFGYSHAKFVPFDGNHTLNRIVSPLFGYCSLSIPSKPTALIIGMGNETNRIYGLKEYFDAVPYLFYSDITYNDKYSKEIEKLNNEIIKQTNPNHLFKFPVNDLIYTNYILYNLCLSLLKDYRVVIAPCGPKPFALLAMINALNLNDSIEVWRISPGNKIGKVNRKPTGLISIIEISNTN